MADKPISGLPVATEIYDNSLFVAEQSGSAVSVSGQIFKNYAKEGVEAYVQQAQEAAEDAADYAATAQEYSGNPPIISGNTWWTWDADEQEYVDTGEPAQGISAYVHIKWSATLPDDNSDMKDTPDAYLGFYSGASATAPVNYTAYVWSKVEGPIGQTGPANSLTIGTVQGGETAGASITGTAPSQILNLTLPKGDASTVPGPQGNPGRGIVSIVRTAGTGAPGTADTYTVTYSDSTTSTFSVYNGADGEGTGDMLKATYDADNDGVVDDAEKLGGQLPAYYAKAEDIPDISGKVDTADLADVATSGSYEDLGDVPESFAPSAHAASHATGGGDALSPADIGAAKTSLATTATMLAASWTGSSAPFSYTLSVAGVTTTSVQEILPSLTITAAELESLQAANIQDGGQTTGQITLKAFGDKPTINLPVRIVLRGDL